jgi:DNA-binding MarR family transcriptional regulator
LGLVERRPHLADRRARYLVITEKAREVLPLLRNIIGESLREALTGLSTKETAILAKALHRVIANLSAARILQNSADALVGDLSSSVLPP